MPSEVYRHQPRHGTQSYECKYQSLHVVVDTSPVKNVLRLAHCLLKACRARGVDCIVAPYEADAQLAYLNKCGIAQLIITEDSDLLLFGCDKVQDLYTQLFCFITFRFFMKLVSCTFNIKVVPCQNMYHVSLVPINPYFWQTDVLREHCILKFHFSLNWQ